MSTKVQKLFLVNIANKRKCLSFNITTTNFVITKKSFWLTVFPRWNIKCLLNNFVEFVNWGGVSPFPCVHNSLSDKKCISTSFSYKYIKKNNCRFLNLYYYICTHCAPHISVSVFLWLRISILLNCFYIKIKNFYY